MAILINFPMSNYLFPPPGCNLPSNQWEKAWKKYKYIKVKWKELLLDKEEIVNNNEESW